MRVDRARLAITILVVWSLFATLYSLYLSVQVSRLASTLEKTLEEVERVSRRAREVEEEARRINETVSVFKKSTVSVNVEIDYGGRVERHSSLLVPKNASVATALMYVADVRLESINGAPSVVEVNGVGGCWRAFLIDSDGTSREVFDITGVEVENGSTIVLRRMGKRC